MARFPKAVATGWLPAVLVAFAVGGSSNSSNFDPIKYVDPLIGSTNGGNVFSGATLPYGMAKAVADTNAGANQAGFNPDGSAVTGFSIMHDSGTGGAPSMGNFPLFPYNGCADDDVNRCAFPKRTRAKFGSYAADSVKAVPGYFGITLNSGPRVEMTTTLHAAVFRFTFKGAPGQKPLILQDLSDLSDTRQDNGTIHVDAGTGRITGSATFVPSFGHGRFTSHFCTDFHGADIADSGIFVDSRASTQVKDLLIPRSDDGYPMPGGAFVHFANGDKPVYARVGISLISREQACANAEAEIPDFDFDKHSEAATQAWREKLSVIVVDTKDVDVSFVNNLYSGFYRTMISPQNYTGENPLWKDGEPYFDSFYCIWDSFRSQFPFLTVVDPEAVAQMVRSLISTYEHDGWLPDCRMSLCRGFTQGGSNADVVLADTYLKGIRRGINWQKGYEAVRKDAEVEPFDWCCRGRGGLDSWKRLGYIPAQDFDYKGFGLATRSISRTLEYAYNDFCIAQIAAGLEMKEDEEKYIASSGNWLNLYKEDQPSNYWNGTSTGFTGFFQPKYLNQTWGFQNPLNCSHIDKATACNLQSNGGESYEGSIWEYGFFVPHNHAELISLYGGPDAFVRRLNYMHDNGITYIGNEPTFLTVFQYHYAGRPALSALRSHFYIPKFFAPTRPGLPGNDDSGAMGSFVAFNMMGLFPNPGQDVYLIIPPYFESVNITNPVTGKTARVRAVNFDPTYKNVYIQSATLNGEPYTKNWINHSFFTEGKELVLTLGKNESSWGTRVQDLPPSLGHYAGFNGTYNKRLVGAKYAARSYKGNFGHVDQGA
ncbi:Glycosyl hydrolase 92 [Tolypocladium paradoxum]|uniref:Glycosyl hydrolase 92 n=1 Tax=Tolypocladium paradoxum TaxID=94208 RepID=A0A2S4KZ08_9HYPO|nr:Glycosyl hydrolase 92 [Tolypocladium paradoxum]